MILSRTQIKSMKEIISSSRRIISYTHAHETDIPELISIYDTEDEIYWYAIGKQTFKTLIRKGYLVCTSYEYFPDYAAAVYGLSDHGKFIFYQEYPRPQAFYYWNWQSPNPRQSRAFHAMRIPSALRVSQHNRQRIMKGESVVFDRGQKVFVRLKDNVLSLTSLDRETYGNVNIQKHHPEHILDHFENHTEQPEYHADLTELSGLSVDDIEWRD